MFKVGTMDLKACWEIFLIGSFATIIFVCVEIFIQFSVISFLVFVVCPIFIWAHKINIKYP